MLTNARAALAAAVLLSFVVRIDPASAAAQRTFVAVTGNDADTCAVAAPCRSFAAAIAQTAPGGEVIVLESGAYGRVTITQPVTIEAPAGVYAGISVFAGTNGIDVSAPGAIVTLRGLSINGQGGNVGINVSAVDRLRIDHCRVSNMGQQGVKITAGSVAIVNAYVSDNGHDGVWSSGLVDVVIRDTVSIGNLSGVSFFAGARGLVRDATLTSNQTFGLYSSAGPTATPTTVRLDGVDVSYNGSTGVYIQGLASSFGSLTITRSTLTGNALNGVWADGSAGPVDATVSDSTLTHHGATYPALAAGFSARMVVSRSTITDNASVAFYQYNSGVFESRGDNAVRNNNAGGIQTVGTITPLAGM
jgi:hypothetical protein